MNVEEEIAKWHQALKGLFLSHSREEMDAWDYKLDDLMSVILAAPIKQLREMAKGLREVMKNDTSIPYFLWAPLDGLGEKILGAPDEGVIQLKIQLAEYIARVVEKDIQPQLSQVIADSLKWRDEEVLERLTIRLKEGQPARLRGRESCLFLEVGNEPDVVAVML